MSDQGPLIVPIIVEAFVVNDHVRLGGGNVFYRAEMQYNALKYPANGQLASDNTFNQPGRSAYFNGVYLKWRLPDAFMKGSQNSVKGTTEFPCVPNRWLVVRYSGAPSRRDATAWLVVSDDRTPVNNPQNVSQTGSMYVMAESGSDGTIPAGVRIGRSVPLATQTWKETGATLKLTAVTPGNPAFAYYQPACNNVFSLMDPLDGHVPAPDTLSYQVFGWFSSGADDPLAKVEEGCDFACRLSELGWNVDKKSDHDWTASWSLMSGMVTGVSWQTASIPPGGAPKESMQSSTPPVSMAIGHTAVEALTAMIAGQGGPGIDTDLLNAFQLDMIDALDKGDPAAVLADAVHSSFFRKYTGGYVWEIVDAPGTPLAPLSASPSVSQETLLKETGLKEQVWLAALNQNQASLDQANRKLTALRRRLHVMWWKYMEFNLQYQGETDIQGLDLKGLRQTLDPSSPGSLAHQVVLQRQVVDAFTSDVVPDGDTPQALNDAIRRFAESHDLPASRLLKRAGAPAFYEPHNPVVLIAGAGASGIVGKQPTLYCRFASQIVTGLHCDKTTTVTAATPHLTIPMPSLTGISGVGWLESELHERLLQEFFFLDPVNAAAIATAAGVKLEDVQAAMKDSASYAGMGILPGGADAAWHINPWTWTQNPWHPLLLTYRADYYPIDYGTPASPNWTFDRGEYTWNGHAAAVGASRSIEGIIQLTPAAVFNMKSRIQKFLDDHPHLDPKIRKEFVDLLAFVNTKDSWDLLSQSLDGFDQQMLLNMTGVFLGTSGTADGTDPLNPAWSLPDLIGPVHGNPPRLGEIPESAPYDPSPFLPWRSGQFLLTDVKVVDEWGQALWPINTSNDTRDLIYLPPEMTATPPVKSGIANFVQIAPALLQPARLGFDLISASDDTLPIGSTPDVDPICGWVLVNHLDRSLMAYDPRGQALGEMSKAMAGNDSPDLCWMDAPDSPYHGLDDIKARLKHFGPFLWTLKQQGPITFTAFLAAIDDTLWTTLPMSAALDRSLAALIGRPLALVRSRLQFELNGPPSADPSWQYTFAPAQPAITGYEFAIELGSAAVLEDGLIGYFSEDDYTTFNVVSGADAHAGQYLKPIGLNNNYIYLPFDAKTVRHVSMLVDPAASVHARTAILPTLAVSVPPQLTASALAAMSVTFRVDGILTDSQPAASPGGQPTVLLPVPHEKRGAWEWVERDEANWTSYTTSANDAAARLSNVLPVLRRGLLRLSGATGAPASVRHRPPNRRIENVK